MSSARLEAYAARVRGHRPGHGPGPGPGTSACQERADMCLLPSPQYWAV